MILKGIGATTHVDRHNCRITKEALINATKDMIDSEYAVGMGVEHDLSVMPIGKVINASVITLEDGEFAMQIEQEIFENRDDTSTFYDTKLIRLKSELDNRPFADTKIENVQKVSVSFDPVNFQNDDFNKFENYIKNECNLNPQAIMRKALIPDPEIIFQLICGTLIYLSGKKTLEKLSDKISTDITNSYDSIKKIIIEGSKLIIPQNRPVTYLFQEKEKYLIELIVVTNDCSVAINSLSSNTISEIHIKCLEFERFFDIAKIQFLFDLKKNNWTFNYLTTKTGESVGTEKCYKRTINLLDKVVTGNQSVNQSLNIIQPEMEEDN